MRFGVVASLVAAVWIGASTAHNIQLKAHSRECFHEELHSGDKMTVTFQVGDREYGGAGNLDIDFYVCKTLRRNLKRATDKTIDNGPFQQLPDSDVDRVLGRLLLRCKERRKIPILLQ
jgi:emp24/gp25L/p24 family/GOLD